MMIIKIGGSLYDSVYLKNWLDGLAAIKNQNIIIVPGGGPFANQVRAASRRWRLSSQTAHDMAVLAMQQYACLIHDLNNKIKFLQSYKDIKRCKHTNSPPDNFIYVWMPYQDVRDFCDYPENWQTSSDSLAVWLASRLNAECLCLLKSVNTSSHPPAQLKNAPFVDEYFKTALKKYPGRLFFYHTSQLGQFMREHHQS